MLAATKSVGNTDLMKKELRLPAFRTPKAVISWKYRPDEEGIKTGTRWCRFRSRITQKLRLQAPTFGLAGGF